MDDRRDDLDAVVHEPIGDVAVGVGVEFKENLAHNACLRICATFVDFYGVEFFGSLASEG